MDLVFCCEILGSSLFVGSVHMRAKVAEDVLDFGRKFRKLNLSFARLGSYESLIELPFEF